MKKNCIQHRDLCDGSLEVRRQPQVAPLQCGGNGDTLDGDSPRAFNYWADGMLIVYAGAITLW